MSDPMDTANLPATASKRQCTARSKRSGDRCRRAPAPGAEVCVMHGAGAPQVRAAARVRTLKVQAEGMLRERNIEPLLDPVSFLADLAGEAREWLDICRENIAALRSWEYTDAKAAMDVRPYITTYERALDRAIKTAEGMSRFGLDREALREYFRLESERPSREQAEAFARVLRHVDLTPEQQQQLHQAMTKEGLL